MTLPFLFQNYQLLLICLTVSSRKDLSIAPCFIGGFHFICRALAEVRFYNDGRVCYLQCLLSIESRESFLKYKMYGGYVVSDFACPNNRCWQVMCSLFPTPRPPHCGTFFLTYRLIVHILNGNHFISESTLWQK
jgi:hypothetical protein